MNQQEVTNADRLENKKRQYEQHLADLKVRRHNPIYENSYNKPIVKKLTRTMSYNKENLEHLSNVISESKKTKPEDLKRIKAINEKMDSIVNKVIKLTKLDKKQAIGTLITTYPLAMPKFTAYAITKGITIDMTVGPKLFTSEINDLVRSLQ